MNMAFITIFFCLSVSALFLILFRRTQASIMSSKMGHRRPGRFRDPLWLHAVLSLLWPLQVVWLFMCAASGDW